MKNFRLLKADEIDCRISTVKETGISLLLYKDARCDMNILDETVGYMNWQKAYSRDNRNCTVSIWDKEKGQWISKEDTGTESYTEAEKGLASDSFKRACFNWGIGRELYTAPFIWIPSSLCEIQPKGNGFTCYNRFHVSHIAYDENERIKELEIVREKSKKMAEGVAYVLKTKTKEEAEAEKEKVEALSKKITKKEAAILSRMLTPDQTKWALETYHIDSLEDMQVRYYTSLIETLKKRERTNAAS